MLKMDAWMACAKALWLKQCQFIQHLFTAVGDTVVTMGHGRVWQVQRGNMLKHKGPSALWVADKTGLCPKSSRQPA